MEDIMKNGFQIGRLTLIFWVCLSLLLGGLAIAGAAKKSNPAANTEERQKVTDTVQDGEKQNRTVPGPVNKPLTEAEKWDALKKAAESGDAEAQYNIGLSYERGTLSVPKNLVTAAEWYEKAEKNGHRGAQNKLAVIYYQGLAGYKKDQAKAAELFEKSVEQGSSDAMFMLGRIYMNGAQGVERDFKRGSDLLKNAASMGNEMAMDDIGVMYYNGNEILSRDRGRSFLWYRRAALKGYTPSMVHLGSMFYYGIEPVDKDEDKGIEWVEKAANKGDERAYNLLVEWGGGKEIEKQATFELKKGGNLYEDKKEQAETSGDDSGKKE